MVMAEACDGLSLSPLDCLARLTLHWISLMPAHLGLDMYRVVAEVHAAMTAPTGS